MKYPESAIKWSNFIRMVQMFYTILKGSYRFTAPLAFLIAGFNRCVIRILSFVLGIWWWWSTDGVSWQYMKKLTCNWNIYDGQRVHIWTYIWNWPLFISLIATLPILDLPNYIWGLCIRSNERHAISSFKNSFCKQFTINYLV